MTAEELQEFLESHNLGPMIKRGHNLMGLCPNHQERRPSWGISVFPPHFHGCFACGYKGTLRSLMMDKLGWSLAQTNKKLGDEKKEGEGLSWIEEKSLPVKNTSMKEVDRKNLWAFLMTPKGFKYLSERGIDKTTIKAAGLLFDERKKRVIFPWFWDNKLVGATGRTILESEERKGKKILAYFNLQKGKVLYVPSGRLIEKHSVILVEGEIDALKVYQSGFKNVAALGHGRFSDQVRTLLVNLPVRSLILFYDSDRRGRELLAETAIKMETICPMYRVDYRAFFGHSKTARNKLDPGGLDEGAIKILIRTAKVLSSWPKF